MTRDPLTYHHGFNNHFESEALTGALVRGRNSPQKAPFGLYAEQISGSAFTMQRAFNLHSWFYRIRPSVVQGDFNYVSQDLLQGPDKVTSAPPTQMRWGPLPYPEDRVDFIQGLVTMAVNGNIEMMQGAAVHHYAVTASMQGSYCYNADGDFLIVPQEGGLRLKTEFGTLDIMPGEIGMLPRGVKFQVLLLNEKARGYVCENFGLPWRLPELGVMGANALANPRDFQVPVASFEELTGDFKLFVKFQGQLWSTDIGHSPLDVIAWHGNYVPYKYNLSLFNTINTVSFDHPDPCIFTVLSSPGSIPGIANVDFVIFPPRWMVAKDTFRPPYYHRNIMNEYMGHIQGIYDAKEKGFLPGGASLHNCMMPHGPDSEAFDKATKNPLNPEYYDNTLAFMFESQFVWRPTAYALAAPFRQKDYLSCWQGLRSNFTPA